MLLGKYSLRHVFFFLTGTGGGLRKQRKTQARKKTTITRNFFPPNATNGNTFSCIPPPHKRAHHPTTLSPTGEIKWNHLYILPKPQVLHAKSQVWASTPLEQGSTERKYISSRRARAKSFLPDGLLMECIHFVYPRDQRDSAQPLSWMELHQWWLLRSWWQRCDEGLWWEGGWTRTHQILGTVFPKFGHQKKNFFGHAQGM